MIIANDWLNQRAPGDSGIFWYDGLAPAGEDKKRKKERQTSFRAAAGLYGTPCPGTMPYPGQGGLRGEAQEKGEKTGRKKGTVGVRPCPVTPLPKKKEKR